MGYTVRTGTLEGLESKAEMLPVRKELLLPWKGFNEKESQFTSSTPLIKGIAKKYMKAGNWDELKPAMQGFLQKNARLVTGHYGNSPAKFVICWSQDQAESQNQVTFNTGNIAHALTIAAAWHVPVFNLARPDAEARLTEEQKDAVKANFSDSLKNLGSSGTLLLDSTMDFETLPVDTSIFKVLDYTNYSSEQIRKVFGIPKSYFGEELTNSKDIDIHKQFHEQALPPLL